MADNILKARVTIKGTRPILWHKFGPEAIPLEKKERGGVAGNDPTEWERTHLATMDGQLYIRLRLREGRREVHQEGDQVTDVVGGRYAASG
jgi:hypothetical protein